MQTLFSYSRAEAITDGGLVDVTVEASSHVISAAERAHILAVANGSRFAKVPPARIVPKLAETRR